MTSREALKLIKNKFIEPELHNTDSINNLFNYIEKDIALVENLKNVLSKVTRVVYQPTWNIEYKVGEGFDIEAFKEILDQLGYTLVKKEEK